MLNTEKPSRFGYNYDSVLIRPGIDRRSTHIPLQFDRARTFDNLQCDLPTCGLAAALRPKEIM